MATATTGWKCTHSASLISQTDTEATIQVKVYWQNDGWTYEVGNISANARCDGRTVAVLTNGSVDTSDGISGNTADLYNSQLLGQYNFAVTKTTYEQQISCQGQIISNNSYPGKGTRNSDPTTITVAAKTHYTITYNANGGTGAPATQTKWCDSNLTITTDKPKRDGYNFLGWATSASGSKVYDPGDSYTENASVTLYAVWSLITYTITYNANGGTGGPTTGTKQHGVSYTIPSQTPTKTNYNFLGWATSKSATTPTYTVGSGYTTNASLTLYAVWQLAYTKPRINDLEVFRCDANGTPSDLGTYFKARFTWATDTSLSLIYIEYYPSSTTNIETEFFWSESGTSGTVETDAIGYGNISTDTTWTVDIHIQDSRDETVVTRIISSSAFSVDAIYDTNTKKIGVALGKAAETTGIVESDLPLYVNGDIYSRNANGVTRSVPVCYNLGDLESVLGSSYVVGLVRRNSSEYGCGVLTINPTEEYGHYGDSIITINATDSPMYSTPIITYYGSVINDVNVDPCVFTYNGVTYGGLRIDNQGEPTFNISFTRLTGNIEPFMVRYSEYFGSVTNDEIYNSITTDLDSTKDCTFKTNFQKIAPQGDLLLSGPVVLSHNIIDSILTLKGNSSGYSAHPYIYFKDSDDNVMGYIGYPSTSDNTLGLYNTTSDGITKVHSENNTVQLTTKGGTISLGYTGDIIFGPAADNSIYLGGSSRRWKTCYAVNGVTTSSDRNVKKDIEEVSDKYSELFNKLQPVTFRFNYEGSDRVHVGFISQDVKAAMDEVGISDLEFAGYCRDIKKVHDEETGKDEEVLDENGNPEYVYSLRYSEFIALNTHMIQKLQKENNELKNNIASLESRLAALEEKIK